MKLFREHGATEYVGLDGVAEQVKTYERRGFQATGLIRLMMHDGLKDGPLANEASRLTEGEEVRNITREMRKEVFVQSDLEHTGLARSRLWTDEALFGREDTFGLYIASASSSATDELEGKDLQGWIVVRSCQEGFRFGPLYATSYERALALLHAAMKGLEGKSGSFITESFVDNANAVKVFEDAGWKWAGLDYHRMWVDGKVPPAQSKAGRGTTDMYACFDAGQG